MAQHRNAVPAAFAQNITLAAHQKAADYTLDQIAFRFAGAGIRRCRVGRVDAAGRAGSLNTWLLGVVGNAYAGLAQQLALFVSFAVIGGVIDLPFTLYQTFVIEERFGFNKMTFKLWLVDGIKSTLIGALIGLPLAALILWLMGAAGNLWWLWTWCVWMGFNLLLLVLYPTVIAPMFNKFKPLEDETLKARVTA